MCCERENYFWYTHTYSTHTIIHGNIHMQEQTYNNDGTVSLRERETKKDTTLRAAEEVGNGIYLQVCPSAAMNVVCGWEIFLNFEQKHIQSIHVLEQYEVLNPCH